MRASPGGAAWLGDAPRAWQAISGTVPVTSASEAGIDGSMQFIGSVGGETRITVSGRFSAR